MEELDGIAWRKSSFSGANGAQCVEIGAAPRTVAVRHTWIAAISALQRPDL